jgi:putative FmdB family regulatory protein
VPIYDFKCDQCEAVTEKITKSDVEVIPCPECAKDKMPAGVVSYGQGLAHRQLSTPASIRMADMEKVNKRRQRIREPIWRMPDGSAKSMY